MSEDNINGLESLSPKVSIIVPTYNVETYAATCFESLIKQTLKDIEIILVDDGSTDSSGEICDEYADKDNRIRVIHQSNIGLGLSRNSGLAIAKGEYIGFVDADDFVSENMFSILFENAKRYNADISYCQFKKFSNEGNAVNNNDTGQFNTKIWRGEEIPQYLLDRIGMPPKSKNDVLYSASVGCGIFSRQCLKKTNAAFVSEREFISEDMIFDIDVIPNCRTIVHTDLQLYYYRSNNDSLTKVYKKDRYEQDLKLYDEMCRRLKKTFLPVQYENSTDRYLLTLTRIAILQEVRFYKMNGYKTAVYNVNKICHSKQLVKVLNDYAYLKLPFKYAFLCFLEKHKMSTLCFGWCYLHEKFLKTH